MRIYIMKKNIINNQDGLTLLEVMVAILILSLSLLLLLNMAMVALDGNDWSNHTTTATQLMQEKLEQIRNVPNLSYSSSGSDSTMGMQRAWKVTNAGNHLRRVDVRVLWTDVRGKTKTNTMTAFVKTDSI